MTTHSNPLLDPHPLPNFDAIQPEHVAPAIELLIKHCNAAVELAADPRTPADFDVISEILDPPLNALGEAWGIVDHLQSVVDTPALRAAHGAAQPQVTAFYTGLSSDLRLFKIYKSIAAESGAALPQAKRKALENALIGFRLSGAELQDAAKQRFISNQMRSAELSTEFSNRLQDSTDAFVHCATEDELAGLPGDVVLAMRHAAKLAGRTDDVCRVTLQQPSLVPVLLFAENRELRQRLYRAQSTRASEFGPAEQDNSALIAELLTLRHDSAALLGHASYAEVSLAMKMADTPMQVQEFLRDIARRGRPQAIRDLAELRDFARTELGIGSLEAWDVAFASERLRESRYAFSAQEVKQYFTLDKVLPGLFEVASQLFDVAIVREPQASWHETVSTYRIERQGAALGRFFLDPYARTAKRGGAWMNGARARWRKPGGDVREAFAYLVTNCAPPVGDQPGLMSHQDVVTLFHEFGHGLHFLLSKVDVPGVAGLGGVEWDAVELPSQLMENFAWEWQILQKISAHAETGEPLPRSLFDKMRAARNFQSGMQLIRQAEMALFDMRIHAEPGRQGEIQAVLDEVRAEVSVFLPPDYNRFQNGFTHVFAGGYAAGYYSYLWAEVLAADAWSVFEAAGPLDASTGARYRTAILERGGSRPMNENFVEFVGRAPEIEAFLRQRGVVCTA